MHICFECGGKLEIISKSGRMAWADDELYEIPVELKISTCLECGQPCEDLFVKNKIANTIRGQKKNKPGPRLLQLRWVDKCIDTVLKNPKNYGNKSAVCCQIVLLLQFREVLLSKGEQANTKNIYIALRKCLQKHWSQPNTTILLKGISLEKELVPVLREFCDVWINT